MLTVFHVAKNVFWSDSMFDRSALPSEASLEKCPYTVVDLAAMSGKERITVFKQCNIDPSLFPLFLRALQHITSNYGAGSIADTDYLTHRFLTARQWSPFVFNPPLTGYPVSNSEPYKDYCAVASPQKQKEKEAEASATEPPQASDTVYVGLLNQGATCYLNSLIQTLFHLSAFRTIIYHMPTKEESEALYNAEVAPAKSIPYALQRLFCYLQTETKAIGTTGLTEAFGWSASDSFIQHDVHELTRVLIDALAEKLDLQAANNNNNNNAPDSKGSGNALVNLFRGYLENYVKVDEVNFTGSREEPFYDLQLVVKNKKNIYESFDGFFQVEILDGKNKYCMESPDGQKSYHRAEKGARFKVIPPVLLLHLTRFDYDIHLGETKVCTRWDYYHTLNLSKYMPKAPPEMTHYTLYSVFVHSGTNAGFGHYYCFIHSKGTWYKFNDEQVTHASLVDVFGSNFGGFRMNYWGSEVPHASNAYMLVYVRTSEMDKLLRPIGLEDIPRHVVDRLRFEKEEEERKQREKEEDYLYGRVHFVQQQDIADNLAMLSARRPDGHTKRPHRMLRVLLEVEALPEFEKFLEQQQLLPTPAPSPSQPLQLWFADTQASSGCVRLRALVKPGMKVRDVVGTSGECCVFVTNPAVTPTIEVDADASVPRNGPRSYQLLHHKLYDPLQLKVILLGSTVLAKAAAEGQDDDDDDNTPATEATMEQLRQHVRAMIAQQPDESKALVGFHLHDAREANLSHPSNGLDAPAAAAPAPAPAAAAAATATPQSQRDDDGNSQAHQQQQQQHPRRPYPTAGISVQCEQGEGVYAPCTALHSGDILVWRLDIAAEDADDAFYPTIADFQHFLRHRIPVEIKLNRPPTFPTLLSTKLADDMTYQQLQRYVARLLGVSDSYDRIRFTRHNPETGLPYFMKGKRKDRATLTRLLTPASAKHTHLSSCVYYEYCKFTVTDIENGHSLQFKLFNNSVRPVSAHWILLSKDIPIEPAQFFEACVREIQKDLKESEGRPQSVVAAAAAANGEEEDTPTTNTNTNTNTTTSGKGAAAKHDALDFLFGDEEAATPSPPQPQQTAQREKAAPAPDAEQQQQDKMNDFLQFILELDPTEAWRTLRLVDVWQGRIYNVLDRDHHLYLEHQTFEESAEYRVECIPEPLPHVAPEQQSLLQICHFTVARQRKNKVETYGDPLSLYVSHKEKPGDLLSRVARKLERSAVGVQDWKVCLVKENRVVETVPDQPMGVQLTQFCTWDEYMSNQKEPSKAAFIGLEHAPTKRRHNHKEERLLILNT